MIMPSLPPPSPAIICVAQAIYHEARGASISDMQKVGELVWNRARDRKKSPCDIIAMRGQFPWYGKASPVREKDMWDEAVLLARNTHWRISPIRYMVATSAHEHFRIHHAWMIRTGRTAPDQAPIHVISADSRLIFYNRYNDNMWKPER